MELIQSQSLAGGPWQVRAGRLGDWYQERKKIKWDQKSPQMRSQGPGSLCEIGEHMSRSRGEWAREKEVRGWHFLFEGNMFVRMSLQEGEGQWR